MEKNELVLGTRYPTLAFAAFSTFSTLAFATRAFTTGTFTTGAFSARAFATAGWLLLTTVIT